ncbi:hypothetical protein HDV05_004302 [Chytridiales sp. JEL 0842]|nr:hypothetical protein HDV05_004302 [Chytridiales sp. JEL 0842]
MGPKSKGPANEKRMRSWRQDHLDKLIDDKHPKHADTFKDVMRGLVPAGCQGKQFDVGDVIAFATSHQLPKLYSSAILSIACYPLEFALNNPLPFSAIPPQVMESLLGSNELCVPTELSRYVFALLYLRVSKRKGPERITNLGEFPGLFKSIPVALALFQFFDRGYTIKDVPRGVKSKTDLVKCRMLQERKVVLRDFENTVMRFSTRIVLPADILKPPDKGVSRNLHSETFSVGPAVFRLQLEEVSPLTWEAILVRLPESKAIRTDHITRKACWIPSLKPRRDADLFVPDYEIFDTTALGISVTAVIPTLYRPLSLGHTLMQTGSCFVLSINEAAPLFRLSSELLVKFSVERLQMGLADILVKHMYQWDGVQPFSDADLQDLQREASEATVLNRALNVNLAISFARF